MKRAFFLASILLTGLPVAQAEPRIQTNAEIAFLERTSLKAADEKCGYLTELERTALVRTAAGTRRTFALRPCGRRD